VTRDVNEDRSGVEGEQFRRGVSGSEGLVGIGGPISQNLCKASQRTERAGGKASLQRDVGPVRQ